MMVLILLSMYNVLILLLCTASKIEAAVRGHSLHVLLLTAMSLSSLVPSPPPPPPMPIQRRALIPPSAGYSDCDNQEPQPPTFATKRQLVNHCKEPLMFEVQLLRVTAPHV